MIGKIKIRCPVCKGTGKVEPGFGGTYNTTCPACDGTGMQEIDYNIDAPLFPPITVPVPVPNYSPPSPCDTCWWTQQMRNRKEPYIGDVPCQWCPNSPTRFICRGNTTDDSQRGGRVEYRVRGDSRKIPPGACEGHLH